MHIARHPLPPLLLVGWSGMLRWAKYVFLLLLLLLGGSICCGVGVYFLYGVAVGLANMLRSWSKILMLLLGCPICCGVGLCSLYAAAAGSVSMLLLPCECLRRVC